MKNKTQTVTIIILNKENKDDSDDDGDCDDGDRDDISEVMMVAIIYKHQLSFSVSLSLISLDSLSVPPLLPL